MNPNIWHYGSKTQRLSWAWGKSQGPSENMGIKLDIHDGPGHDEDKKSPDKKSPRKAILEEILEAWRKLSASSNIIQSAS